MTKRFGIIGCGRIAPRHADTLADIPDAELVQVCDVIESRAHAFAEKYGAAYCLNYHDLLANPEVDIVNICTPSGMHAEMTIAALKAGKHVIVEKPMAMNPADADRMIAAAKEADRKLCIVLQNRYNPPMQDFYHAVRDGKIGHILLGSVTVRWYRPQEYYNDGWHGTKSMDGGALMNQSIHHIDALQWLVGVPVKSVFAYTATLAHQMEAEDAGVVVVKFENGALATIEGSTVTYPQNLEASVALFGEKGSLKVGGTALNRKVFWKIAGEIEHEKELLTREEVDPPSIYGASHRHVIEDMMQAIDENREPQTNGAEGRKSLVLVNAMYESARTAREVFLSE
ncbi:MAG: Gfo/Idh/MocA family oxidoreductase [Anaerolineales bacterium]|nr:Gfo/Idh/MocA family oxidoreductase [Anaerolineales bacterium]